MARPWKIVTVVGAALGAFGLVSLFSRTAAAAPLVGSGRRRVALIGDSYAVGLGPELAKLLGDGFQFEGHVGENTSARVAAGLPNWLPGFQPDLVLVSLGVNDGCGPNAANYQAILQALRALGTNVVWIEPPANVYGGSTAACQNVPAVRDVIRSLGVQTIATAIQPGADGLHPSYAPWAAEIAQVVNA